MSLLNKLLIHSSKYFIFLICFHFIDAAEQPSWIHYVDDAITSMEMNSILTVGNDLVVSTGGIVTVIKDSQIVTCNTSIVPIMNNIIFNWMQYRSNGELWCFNRVNDTYLYRFSGIGFTPLDTSVYSPFPPDIAATFETRSGSLWACTVDSGAFILNGLTWQPVEGSPKGKTFVPCLEDSSGNIWGNVALDGVYCFKPQSKTWIHYTPANSGLTTIRTRDIITDKNGNIIICSDEIFTPNDEYTSGIFVFNGSTWTKYDTSNTDMITSDALCMARDSTGNIWIGSREGVIKWDGNNKWENMCGGVTPYKPCGFIHDIEVDAKNRIWVAGFHWGFFLLEQSGIPCEPQILITTPVQSTIVKPASSLNLRWEYQGPVGDIKIEYRNNLDQWIEIAAKVANGKVFKWNVPQLSSSSNYQIRISSVENVVVFDTSARFTIADSTANLPPSFISLPDSITIKANETTTLTIHATDPEKDTIKFTYANLPSWASASDSVLTFKPLESNTGFTFTVTVSDGKGGSTTDSVKVIVNPSTGNKTQFRNKSLQPFVVNKTASLLSITSGETSTIYSAALYTLSGKNAGVFLQHRKTFTLERSAVSLNGSIFVVKVNVDNLRGGTKTFSRLLLWQ